MPKESMSRREFPLFSHRIKYLWHGSFVLRLAVASQFATQFFAVALDWLRSFTRTKSFVQKSSNSDQKVQIVQMPISQFALNRRPHQSHSNQLVSIQSNPSSTKIKMSLPDENRCKYKGCGLYFPTLTDVIVHIEAIHFVEWQAKQNSTIQVQPDSTSIEISSKDDSIMVVNLFQDGSNLAHRSLLQNNMEDSPNPSSCSESNLEFLRYPEESQDLPFVSVPMSAIQRFTRPADETSVVVPVRSVNSLNSQVDCYNYELASQMQSVSPIPLVELESTPLSMAQELSKEVSLLSVSDMRQLQKLIEAQANEQTEAHKKKGQPMSKLLDQMIKQELAMANHGLSEFDYLAKPSDNYYSRESIIQGSRRNAEIAKINATVEDPKPFKCPVFGCIKEYKNINGLRYHASFAHKGPIELQCGICGALCKTPQGLGSHRTRHAKLELLQKFGPLHCYEKLSEALQKKTLKSAKKPKQIKMEGDAKKSKGESGKRKTTPGSVACSPKKQRKTSPQPLMYETEPFNIKFESICQDLD